MKSVRKPADKMITMHTERYIPGKYNFTGLAEGIAWCKRAYAQDGVTDEDSDFLIWKARYMHEYNTCCFMLTQNFQDAHGLPPGMRVLT
jgi:hypothetical protein